MDRITTLETQLVLSKAKEPKLADPTPFTGNKGATREFIAKCETIFDNQPARYPTHTTKIAFLTNLLKDEAYRWFLLYAISDNKPAWLGTYAAFKTEFLRIFSDTDTVENARMQIKELRQKGSASAYTTAFNQLASYLNWNDEALRGIFFDNLKEDVKDRLLSPSEFSDLADLQTKAVNWDNLLFQRRRTHTSKPPAQGFAQSYYKLFLTDAKLSLLIIDQIFSESVFISDRSIIQYLFYQLSITYGINDRT